MTLYSDKHTRWLWYDGRQPRRNGLWRLIRRASHNAAANVGAVLVTVVFGAYRLVADLHNPIWWVAYTAGVAAVAIGVFRLTVHLNG